MAGGAAGLLVLAGPSAACASAGPSADGPDPSTGQAADARVVRIVDGDTVILDGPGELLDGDDTRVRLLEVDAPESAIPDQPVECWGREAAGRLADLLPVGSEVTVRRDEELLDPYGRTLLYVWNDDDVFVNLELVRSGAAEAVLFEPNDRHIERLRDAEEEARAEGRGLWGACR